MLAEINTPGQGTKKIPKACEREKPLSRNIVLSITATSKRYHCEEIRIII